MKRASGTDADHEESADFFLQLLILLIPGSATGPETAGGLPVSFVPADLPGVFQALPFLPEAPAVER